MKKSVLLALALVMMGAASVSAQGFLKKLGESAKKAVTTEATASSAQPEAPAEDLIPVAVLIESTRIIGDKLIISGKMNAPEDFRLMNVKSSIITPDGTSYELHTMWWGENVSSLVSFSETLIAGINYAFDMAFDIKSKKVTEITALNIDAFNHTAQQKFKIAMRNLIVPIPPDPELSNPTVTEIDKNVYLRWTGAEESADGLKLNYVIENKNDNDKKVQFKGISTIATTIIDTNGTSHEAKASMECNQVFPAGIPVAGSITLNKPVKVSQIALLEFASRHFNYRIKGIVLPN